MDTTVSKVKEIVDTLSSCPGHHTRYFVSHIVEQLRIEHRTTQANFIRNLQSILVEFANENSGTDPRNEDAINFCKKVAEMDDKYISYI